MILFFNIFWGEEDNSEEGNSEKKEIRIRSNRNGAGIKAGSENIPSAAGRRPEEIYCSTSGKK
jgi:hypothetical protein